MATEKSDKIIMYSDADNYRNFIIELNEQFSDCCEMRDLLARVIFEKMSNKKNFLTDILNSDSVSNAEKKNMLDFAYTQRFISSSELENCNVFHIDKN